MGSTFQIMDAQTGVPSKSIIIKYPVTKEGRCGEMQVEAGEG